MQIFSNTLRAMAATQEPWPLSRPVQTKLLSLLNKKTLRERCDLLCPDLRVLHYHVSFDVTKMILHRMLSKPLPKGETPGHHNGHNDPLIGPSIACVISMMPRLLIGLSSLTSPLKDQHSRMAYKECLSRGLPATTTLLCQSLQSHPCEETNVPVLPVPP